MESRRKEGNPRGIYVFKQYAEKYVKTRPSSRYPTIDTINRKKFKKMLVGNLKYEFKNKKELIDFANNIFEKIGINDDLNHNISVRDELEYDYLLNTNNKTKKQIYEEFNKILS